MSATDTTVAVAGDLLGKLLVGVVIAAVGAVIGLRSYYRQKWWEKKWTGYTDLIEALLHLALQFRSMRNLEVVNWTPEELAASKGRIRESLLQLNRSVALGELLCSKKAMDVLSTFRSEWQGRIDSAKPDFHDVKSMTAYIATGQTIAENALDGIRQAAMADLGLGRDRSGRMRKR